ncbi:hypothetical protein UFOVP118_19 [uncultured Caudovirales phage]|uniref:Uncharacterized protein n=1 Tax=uncultured Caudovirales phage TaxID=2100421 RepID=A0A6J5LCF4_9CAUD|nr:hypothetical protein UFOVP118_19 [uncultured Caudovirales phage]
MKYEIQEYTICDGWINNWSTMDEDGTVHKTYFVNEEEAKTELDCFFYEMMDAVEAGNMEDAPDREEFRIVEVA